MKREFSVEHGNNGGIVIKHLAGAPFMYVYSDAQSGEAMQKISNLCFGMPYKTRCGFVACVDHCPEDDFGCGKFSFPNEEKCEHFWQDNNHA